MATKQKTAGKTQDELSERVGARLVKLREKRGLSQADVIRLCDGLISATHIKSMEAGDKNVTVLKLEAYLRKIEFTLGEFFEEWVPSTNIEATDRKLLRAITLALRSPKKRSAIETLTTLLESSPD